MAAIAEEKLETASIDDGAGVGDMVSVASGPKRRRLTKSAVDQHEHVMDLEGDALAAMPAQCEHVTFLKKKDALVEYGKLLKCKLFSHGGLWANAWSRFGRAEDGTGRDGTRTRTRTGRDGTGREEDGTERDGAGVGRDGTRR